MIAARPLVLMIAVKTDHVLKGCVSVRMASPLQTAVVSRARKIATPMAFVKLRRVNVSVTSDGTEHCVM